MLPLLLATSNPHKLEELRAIFAPEGIRVIGLPDLPNPGALIEPEETGKTFEENAFIKALGYAQQTSCICLADDSGLEVDALSGAPGVISSHYATDGRETGLSRPQRDAANNDRLLRELRDVPPDRRTARFVCVMAVAAAPPHPLFSLTARGTFEGRIGTPPEVPRGSNGFGYDPLFLLPDGRTSAELSPHEKNALSHRGQAARLIAARISQSGILVGE
jgi:XTP/dITP diphosphohydrolase